MARFPGGETAALLLRCAVNGSYRDLGNRRGWRYAVFSIAGSENPMARSAWVALVAALLFGAHSIATAKTRGAAHRNPVPHRITETGPRSGVLPPEQQCGSQCDPYGHAITGGN